MSLANVEAVTGIQVKVAQARFEGVIPHADSTGHKLCGIVEPHGGGTFEPIRTFFVESEDVDVLFDHASNGRPAIARRTQGDGLPFTAQPRSCHQTFGQPSAVRPACISTQRSGTAIYADNLVAAAYTEAPGEQVIRLPKNMRLVDLVSGRVINRGTSQVRFSAPGPTTAAWQTEKSRTLR